MAVDTIRSSTPRIAVAAKAQGPDRAPVPAPKRDTADVFIQSGTTVAGAAFMGVATFALVGARSGPIGWGLMALNAAIGAMAGTKLFEMLRRTFREGDLTPSIGGVIGGVAGGAIYGVSAAAAAIGGLNPIMLVGVGVCGLLAGAFLGKKAEDGIRSLFAK